MARLAENRIGLGRITAQRLVTVAAEQKLLTLLFLIHLKLIKASSVRRRVPISINPQSSFWEDGTCLEATGPPIGLFCLRTKDLSQGFGNNGMITMMAAAGQSDEREESNESLNDFPICINLFSSRTFLSLETSSSFLLTLELMYIISPSFISIYYWLDLCLSPHDMSLIEQNWPYNPGLFPPKCCSRSQK